MNTDYMFNGHEYICNKCGKMYMHRGSLQRHSKFECGVTPKFGCGFCGRRFSQRSNLSRHVVDIHRSALEEFINKRSESRNEVFVFTNECPRCFKTYKHKRNLRQHLFYECGVDPKFSCDICNKKFVHKQHKNRHIISIHKMLPNI